MVNPDGDQPEERDDDLYYTTEGFLQSMTGPVTGATTTYTYDSYGRVERRRTPTVHGLPTIRCAEPRDQGHLPRWDFPQDRIQPARHRGTHDRLGRITRHTLDALRRDVITRDPLGRVTTKQWCTCGGLDALIDRKGQKTTWERDLQGRVTRERRSDGTTARLYTYEPASGRLKTVTDARLQVGTRHYHLDDTLQSVAYTNTSVPTSSISYVYDAGYNRVASVTDAAGVTTYAYHPAGSAERADRNGRWAVVERRDHLRVRSAGSTVLANSRWRGADAHLRRAGPVR